MRFVAGACVPSATAAFHEPAYHFQVTLLAVSRSPMLVCVCGGSVVALAVSANRASLPVMSTGALSRADVEASAADLLARLPSEPMAAFELA